MPALPVAAASFADPKATNTTLFGANGFGKMPVCVFRGISCTNFEIIFVKNCDDCATH